MTDKLQLRHVPEWSVVRISDGRVGFKGHWTRPGHGIVCLAGGTGVELRNDALAEVIRFPAQLAGEWVEAHPEGPTQPQPETGRNHQS